MRHIYTHEVIRAGSGRVRALVAGELEDEDTGVTDDVRRADAAMIFGARRGDLTVGLRWVHERTSLVGSMVSR